MTEVTQDKTRPAAQPPGPGATPMMAQYLEIRTANPDCLLFYRMGDFYELFFEDAVAASAALGIALTKRGQHRGEDVPMAGVPVHAAQDYLKKLIALGYRVAVCEQMEDPAEAKKRGSKAVVKRAVTRHVTPGTITEDGLLDARMHHALAAIAADRTGDTPQYAIAWTDISTGEVEVGTFSAGGVEEEIARITPREILVSEAQADYPAILSLFRNDQVSQTVLSPSAFDSLAAENLLKRHYGVATLDGVGRLGRAELSALGAIAGYVDRTQAGKRAALALPRRRRSGDIMLIDPATRASLELTRNLKGERKGSLLSVVDRTVTAAGSRLLATRIGGPATEPAEINRQLDAVGVFVEEARLRTDLRATLRAAPDMMRALSRLSLERGSPRDLGAIRTGLNAAREAAVRLDEAGVALKAAPIEAACSGLRQPDPALLSTLGDALADDLPPQRRDGGFVKAGYRPALDEARRLRDDSRKVIAALQERYAADTTVKALKIKHNNVLGYFVEVTAQNADRLFKPPLSETFIHRQTLANAVRFTTVELGALERKIVAAGDEALAIEQAVFAELQQAVIAETAALRACSEALAALDVYAGLAELAESEGYSRPTVDASLTFKIDGGRHPVVEDALNRTHQGPFVTNDCDLSPAEDGPPGKGRMWLLTGPNMAGKSTFLRQNALIAVLAQAGSYVPARTAHIGVADRLFSRVGASDDLAQGRSTFMVEMVETAAILNQAGPRAIVILDEIGRGTATFDGLSIAWAAIEHLHEVNHCRVLFATHYHELTALSGMLPRVENATMRVREWKGEVVFLHEVTAGAADRSYGIQVAKLAGLPPAVVERAKDILARLESGERGEGKATLIDDLPLFSSRPAPAAAAHIDPLRERLDAIHPDNLTPREALEIVYELKAALRAEIT